MSFGNFYGPQPGYFPQPAPDALNQFKAPYQQYQQPQQQSGGLMWVQGEAGAKSYLVAPGQSVLLMDSEGSRFYLKSADASGMPMPLRIFEYAEVTGRQTAPVDAQYITREEFEARLAQILTPKEEEDNV